MELSKMAKNGQKLRPCQKGGVPAGPSLTHGIFFLLRKAATIGRKGPHNFRPGAEAKNDPHTKNEVKNCWKHIFIFWCRKKIGF